MGEPVVEAGAAIDPDRHRTRGRAANRYDKFRGRIGSGGHSRDSSKATRRPRCTVVGACSYTRI